jgi:predicted MFS family arabinose efflux permease
VRRLLALACAIVFVDTTFYAAITPLLPHFEDEFGLSKSAAGVLVAAYPAGTLAGALPGGYLAARWGVRATVLLGLGLMIGSSFAFAFADSLAVLDAARFVQGVGGAASWAGAMAWVASAAPRDRRGEMIGTALGAAIAGSLVGPVLGALGDAFGIAPVFCGVAVVGVLLSIWALRTPPAAPEGTPTARELLAALRDGRVAGGIWLIAVPGLVFGTISVLGPLRLDELGLGAAAIGATWLCAALLEAGVSPVVGRVSDRRGRLRHRADAAVPVAAGGLAARRARPDREPDRGDAVRTVDGAAVGRRRGARDRAGARLRAQQRRLVDRAGGRRRGQRAPRRRDERRRALPAAGLHHARHQPGAGPRRPAPAAHPPRSWVR